MDMRLIDAELAVTVTVTVSIQMILWSDWHRGIDHFDIFLIFIVHWSHVVTRQSIGCIRSWSVHEWTSDHRGILTIAVGQSIHDAILSTTSLFLRVAGSHDTTGDIGVVLDRGEDILAVTVTVRQVDDLVFGVDTGFGGVVGSDDTSSDVGVVLDLSETVGSGKQEAEGDQQGRNDCFLAHLG